MLTERQAEVLATIVVLSQAKGYPPTMRELGVALGISSTNGVTEHLDRLAAKGFIARDPKSARSIRILRTPEAQP